MRDSDFTHCSENESEEEQTVNKAAASSVEDDRSEQAAVVTAATEEDDPVLIYKDVGYINFSATGQASIGQLLKEAMVRQGYDCFQNADANFAKEEFGSKATVRGTTPELVCKTAEKRHCCSTNMVNVFATQRGSFLFLLLAVSKQPTEQQVIV